MNDDIDSSADALLRDFESSGLLRSGKRVDKTNDLFLRSPIRLKCGASVLEALLAEREENRY